jgi:hypothetical protein
VLRGGRFKTDQAEIVFCGVALEQIGELTAHEATDLLAEIVNLCAAPDGKHPLSGVLAGWNTLDVLGGHRRVVYKASTSADDVGLIEVLCIGPRTDNEVYDMAAALVDAGLLDGDEITDLFDSLAVLAIVAEEAGVDGWDYRPPPAPEGMVKAAVASGILDAATASSLSKPELEAAFEGGFTAAGVDPMAALTAALERARARPSWPSNTDLRSIINDRAAPRCGAPMPRAGAVCIRKEGHPGPHRASV